MFMPVTVAGDRQYFISVKHGKLYDKDVSGVPRLPVALCIGRSGGHAVCFACR